MLLLSTSSIKTTNFFSVDKASFVMAFDKLLKELEKEVNSFNSSWAAFEGIIISISFFQNKVVFCVGETILSATLIEGKFPNYEQVVPKNKTTVAKIDKNELLQCLRRAALLTSTEAPAVKVDFLKGRVMITARTPNLGEAKEEATSEMEGKEMAIGFNPDYLMDVLKNLDVDTITFSLSEPDKPGVVSGKEGYFYVIMPMQIH